MVFANASNWLWIDKNSKSFGGLAMPWSYSINTSLFISRFVYSLSILDFSELTLSETEYRSKLD
jgi:lipid A ethanolaminephosphotransferase